MKQILCKKNQLTKIISNFGRGYPQTFNVTLIPEGNEEVSGIYIEKRYFWIFPETPIVGDLKEKMQFRRYWINGIYSVAIKPNNNVVVEY
ncbi:hypothetical protein ACFLSS_04580 [Bacteroidota bacterium]